MLISSRRCTGKRIRSPEPVKPEGKLNKLVESIESNPLLKGIVFLAILIGLIWGAVTFIDSRVRSAVLNDEKLS